MPSAQALRASTAFSHTRGLNVCRRQNAAFCLGSQRRQFDGSSDGGTIGGMIVALRNERGRKLISCRDAADAYGCSMSYIRRLARLGRLETEEVGGSYLFDEAEVKRLAAQADKGEGRHRKRAEGFKPG